MVAEYGMSEKVGPLFLGHEDPNSMFGEVRASRAARRRRSTRRSSVSSPRPTIKPCASCTEHRELLDRLSGLLLVTETIDGADLEAYAAGTKVIPDPVDVRREADERAENEAAASALPAPTKHVREPRITLPPAPPLPTN